MFGFLELILYLFSFLCLDSAEGFIVIFAMVLQKASPSFSQLEVLEELFVNVGSCLT